MHEITRRHVLAGTAGAAALGAAGLPSLARAADPLVVTSYGGSREKFFRGEIIPPFEKEAKGKVDLAVGLSKDWLANMRAAGVEAAPYDVLMTNEAFASIERVEGFFETLSPD